MLFYAGYTEYVCMYLYLRVQFDGVRISIVVPPLNMYVVLWTAGWTVDHPTHLARHIVQQYTAYMLHAAIGQSVIDVILCNMKRELISNRAVQNR